MSRLATQTAGLIRLVRGGVALVLIATGGAIGQSPLTQSLDFGQVEIRTAAYVPRSAAISVESDLVETRVVVRDRKGHPAGGLTRADFTVLDNGSPQKIASFEEEICCGVSPPGLLSTGRRGDKLSGELGAGPNRRYIAFFFDDIHTGASALRRSGVAARRLITADLAKSDHLAIFTNSGAVEQDFTQDHQALTAALDRLRPHSSGLQAFSVCPTLTALQAYVIAHHLDPQATRTALEDAVACNCPAPTVICKNCSAAQDPCIASQTSSVQATAETVWEMARNHSSLTLSALGAVLRRLARAPGERTLVIVSSGFPSGDLRRQTDELIASALQDEIVVDAINGEGLATTPSDLKLSSLVHDQVLSEFMAAAAGATGGQMVRNTNDLVTGFRGLVAPDVSYRIGFAAASDAAGSYHRLSVRLRNCPGCTVLARRGYFAARQSGRQENVQDRIDREAASDTTVDELPVRVYVASSAAHDDRVPIRVQIHLDIRGLRFREQAGHHIQQLTFIAVLRSINGSYVDGKEAVMDLILRPEKLLAMQASGLEASFSFLVPHGAYNLRQVCRQAVQNRWSALTTAFEAR